VGANSLAVSVTTQFLGPSLYIAACALGVNED